MYKEDQTTVSTKVEPVEWAVQVDREPLHTMRLPSPRPNAQNAHTRVMAAAMRAAFGR